MAELWPWLAIAGVGALHAASPSSGWLLAAACGVHAGDRAQARRALGPIAVGQVASMAVLAGAVSLGLSIDRALMRELAVALALAAVLWLCWRRARSAKPLRTTARNGGIALGSFLIASAQGAGLVLVPALMPLCAGSAPTRDAAASAGPWAFAVVAVAVHTAAMLLTTGVIASGVCRGWARLARGSPRPWNGNFLSTRSARRDREVDAAIDVASPAWRPGTAPLR